MCVRIDLLNEPQKSLREESHRTLYGNDVIEETLPHNVCLIKFYNNIIVNIKLFFHSHRILQMRRKIVAVGIESHA